MPNAALDLPTQGRMDGAAHRFPVRVYFEDTDLSGVVYHANYLRFMERARSDMLTCAGIDQRAVVEGRADGVEGVYAVAELSIRYRVPARLDDNLIVVSRILQVLAATTTIHQTVMRGPDILTEAQLTAAFLTRDGRPQRQPKPWVAIFKALIEEPA